MATILPAEPSAKLNYSKVKDKDILESTSAAKIIRHLLDKAGVSRATVTSLARTPEGQANAMFKNLNSGVVVDYNIPGQRVVDVYRAEKKKLNLGDSITNGLYITAPQDKTRVINLMHQEVVNQGPSRVSKHCCDLGQIIVLDISPSSVVYRNNVKADVGHGKFINTFLKETTGSNGNAGLLSRFLFPHKFASYAQKLGTPDDPKAFHIEIKSDTAFNTSANNALPDVEFKFKNLDFKTADGRKAPFANDIVKYAGIEENKESTSDARS